jgi:hypothetical protein
MELAPISFLKLRSSNATHVLQKRKKLKLYNLNAATSIPESTRSFSEILSDLQRSKVSIKDWSLSDLTIGLYLIYLSQASAKNAEAFKGVQISSNKKV